ncbi:hypothetical protein BBF96_10770 [Anoxybacter fermentans]|uniref:Uncharacterized protein n=1 Tax=Anoxybacter fermentans TaxID=1323375 RepID=A0A3Q9HR32_9FIRM|nr:DsrE family protein [Anoxybacter fermentans]AZR73826.1 hypothetical protein BBF96_10770 [Anoxybacter fermentans]
MSERPVFVFTSNKFGKGPEDLGDILMRGLISNLTKVEPAPQVLIFLNSGVQLLTKSEIQENLNILEEKGVKILACGTCVNYFNLQDKIKNDYISNMGEILSIISNAQKVVNLS